MPQTIAQLQECIKRTTHFVPKETIAAMAINYEPWKWELIVDFLHLSMPQF
jgi:hypothetical protein